MAIALAGGVGAWLRGELTSLGRRRGWRHGRVTLIVNVLGSVALGFVAGAGDLSEVPASLGTGFLAGFTTFSTWIVEALRRTGDDNQIQLRTGHLVAMLVAGLSGAAVGVVLGGG